MDAAPPLSVGKQSLILLLGEPNITAARIAAHLDSIATDERVLQCRALNGKQMARLYEVAAGGEALTLDDLVPPSLPEGEAVKFAGKNSLPMHTEFEKHFARLDGAIVGMNVQSLSFFSGPGYYTCRAAEKPGELLFDYTQIPARAPTGWPPPRSNARGLSNFIYKNLHDYNRRVSRDVVIGFATRLGKPIDSYYVLARI